MHEMNQYYKMSDVNKTKKAHNLKVMEIRK